MDFIYKELLKTLYNIHIAIAIPSELSNLFKENDFKIEGDTIYKKVEDQVIQIESNYIKALYDLPIKWTHIDFEFKERSNSDRKLPELFFTGIVKKLPQISDKKSDQKIVIGVRGYPTKRGKYRFYYDYSMGNYKLKKYIDNHTEFKSSLINFLTSDLFGSSIEEIKKVVVDKKMKFRIRLITSKIREAFIKVYETIRESEMPKEIKGGYSKGSSGYAGASSDYPGFYFLMAKGHKLGFEFYFKIEEDFIDKFKSRMSSIYTMLDSEGVKEQALEIVNRTIPLGETYKWDIEYLERVKTARIGFKVIVTPTKETPKLEEPAEETIPETPTTKEEKPSKLDEYKLKTDSDKVLLENVLDENKLFDIRKEYIKRIWKNNVDDKDYVTNVLSKLYVDLFKNKSEDNKDLAGYIMKLDEKDPELKIKTSTLIIKAFKKLSTSNVK